MHQLKPLSYKCVQKKGKLISDSLGQTKKKCGGGGGETTIGMQPVPGVQIVERDGKWGAS